MEKLSQIITHMNKPLTEPDIVLTYRTTERLPDEIATVRLAKRFITKICKNEVGKRRKHSPSNKGSNVLRSCQRKIGR